jgi:hypothetical protein
LGIPSALIGAAAESEPQGFVLFQDLPGRAPGASGSSDQATTEQSET